MWGWLGGSGAEAGQSDTPALAVSRLATENGVVQGEPIRIKYRVPQSYVQAVKGAKLWIGVYEGGQGQTVIPEFRLNKLEDVIAVETSAFEAGKQYQFFLREGEVWPLITTHDSSKMVTILPNPLLQEKQRQLELQRQRDLHRQQQQREAEERAARNNAPNTRDAGLLASESRAPPSQRRQRGARTPGGARSRTPPTTRPLDAEKRKAGHRAQARGARGAGPQRSPRGGGGGMRGASGKKATRNATSGGWQSARLKSEAQPVPVLAVGSTRSGGSKPSAPKQRPAEPASSPPPKSSPRANSSRTNREPSPSRTQSRSPPSTAGGGGRRAGTTRSGGSSSSLNKGRARPAAPNNTRSRSPPQSASSSAAARSRALTTGRGKPRSPRSASPPPIPSAAPKRSPRKPRSHLNVGDKVEAVWEVDEEWHPALISDVTGDTYTVEFTEQQLYQYGTAAMDVRPPKNRNAGNNPLSDGAVRGLYSSLVDQELVRDFVAGVKVKDRTAKGQRLRNSFVGSTAVSWLLANVPALNSREDAVNMGRDMMRLDVFHHHEKGARFVDRNTLYVLDTTHAYVAKALSARERSLTSPRARKPTKSGGSRGKRADSVLKDEYEQPAAPDSFWEEMERKVEKTRFARKTRTPAQIRSDDQVVQRAKKELDELEDEFMELMGWGEELDRKKRQPKPRKPVTDAFKGVDKRSTASLYRESDDAISDRIDHVMGDLRGKKAPEPVRRRPTSRGTPPTTPSASYLGVAKVSKAFFASRPTQLTVQPGMVVQVLDRPSRDYFLCAYGNLCGLIPTTVVSNFIPATRPPMPPSRR